MPTFKETKWITMQQMAIGLAEMMGVDVRRPGMKAGGVMLETADGLQEVVDLLRAIGEALTDEATPGMFTQAEWARVVDEAEDVAAVYAAITGKKAEAPDTPAAEPDDGGGATPAEA